MISENQILETRKCKIDGDLNILVFSSIKLALESDGQKCGKCVVIQGEPSKGFKKYYCKHVTDKIDKKLIREKKEITLRIMDVGYQDVETIF